MVVSGCWALRREAEVLIPRPLRGGNSEHREGTCTGMWTWGEAGKDWSLREWTMMLVPESLKTRFSSCHRKEVDLAGSRDRSGKPIGIRQEGIGHTTLLQPHSFLQHHIRGEPNRELPTKPRFPQSTSPSVTKVVGKGMVWVWETVP
jgi:hypothetical protein